MHTIPVHGVEVEVHALGVLLRAPKPRLKLRLDGARRVVNPVTEG
jgi:hypothetical protein